MILRPYQHSAEVAILDAVRRDENPVVCMPTGSGKSLVAAAVAADLARNGQPGIVATHRRELIAQDAAALGRYDPEIRTGIYSAGLDRRDRDQPVIFAGVQSAFRTPEMFGDRGWIMVDEVHLVPPRNGGDDAGSMYQQFMDAYPAARRIGLSATPYRLDNGPVWGDGPDTWYDTLAYQASARDLIDEGYLAPLVGRRGLHEVPTEGVRTQRGDFVATDLAQTAENEALVKGAVAEIIAESGTGGAVPRQHCLVFACSIDHAEMIQRELSRQGESAGVVHGKLRTEDRDAELARFRAGENRWLVNCMILTTGYDFPGIDCIAVLRPTASKSLHVQMLGRGMRLAERKPDCLILDFAGNCDRHGDIDLFPDPVGRTAALAAADETRERKTREARQREYRHAMTAAGVDPMSGGGEGLREEEVVEVSATTAPAKSQPGKSNVIITYRCRSGARVRRWLCPEYETGAKWYAIQWLRRRGVMAPITSAVRFARAVYSLPIPETILVRRGERGYDELVMERFPGERVADADD